MGSPLFKEDDISNPCMSVFLYIIPAGGIFAVFQFWFRMCVDKAVPR